MNLAHCDLQTGKIYGCKKGSWEWYHEKGHFRFNKEKRFSLLILLNGYSHDIWIFCIMVTLIIKNFIYPTIFFFLLYFGFFLFEEWWCNKFADRKFYK